VVPGRGLSYRPDAAQAKYYKLQGTSASGVNMKLSRTSDWGRFEIL
jgi:hypothetical protein